MGQYGMEIPAWTKNIRNLGEAGTFKTGKDRNLGDYGVMMIFVWFTNNHGSDVFRILHLNTHKTTNHRDVI